MHFILGSCICIWYAQAVYQSNSQTFTYAFNTFLPVLKLLRIAYTQASKELQLIDCRAQFPPFKSHKMREAVDMKWTHAKHRAMRTICAWSCAPCMPQARKGQSPKCYWEAYTYCCYYCYYSDWQVRYYNEKFYIPVIYLMMKMMLVCSMAIKTWICM